ncbi:MAG: hypothetical protein L3J12_03450 [Spirochaetales bacterium]|nr:hypothetical protein [Spirochaetales bacterium]
MDIERTNSRIYNNLEGISQIPTLILDEIRNLFYSYFDHPWLINIFDELPENPGSFGTIRSFLALRSIHPDENSLILNGILSLKKMVRIINIWLIPESTVILGISPLATEKKYSNIQIRKCIAYTLPVNTRNLAALVEDLEKEIIRISLLES